MFSLSSPQDLFYVTGAISLLWITGFLCWALYQIGKLFKQSNEVMTEARDKMTRFEQMVVAIGEKIGNVSQYLGFIAEGGKQLLGFLHMREEKEEKRTTRKTKEKGVELSDLPNEN